jgi:hypothetical protein
MRFPSYTIVPRSARSRPVITRNVVVFPAPFAPSTVTTAPRGTCSDTPWRARMLPYDAATPSSFSRR